MKTIVKITFWVFCFVVFLDQGIVCHANDIVVTSAEYEIVDGEDKSVAVEIARFSAMRDAIEQICVLIESDTEIKELKLSKDIIYTASSGILQIVHKKIEWVTESKVRVSLESTLKKDKVRDVIDKCISDSAIVLQYKKMNDAIKELNERITQKKNELKTAKDSIQKNEIRNEIKQVSQEFLGTIWFETALTQCVAGLYDDAFLSLDTALSFNPNYANAHGLKGNIHQHKNQFDLALKEYNTALELLPNYSDVLYCIALINKQQQNYYEALEYLNRALYIDPYLGIAYNLRASIFSLLNKPTQAIQDYKLSLNINYRDYDALVGVSVGRKSPLRVGRFSPISVETK